MKDVTLMSLKSDLKALAKFSENPYDATYKPKKEMIRLYVGLMITLPIFLGFCCQFYILASAPIFIYWIVIYFRAAEYWKELGWKMRWYYIPAAIMTVFGLYLAISQNLVKGIGWLISNVWLFK